MQTQFMCLSLSYKTASVEVRERAAMSTTHQAHLLMQAAAGDLLDVAELVILSTCNRTELYAIAGTHGVDTLFEAWRQFSALTVTEQQTLGVLLEGQACIDHVLEVSAGLDSQVIGEPQILGQVADAYELARTHHAAGTMLSALMQHAIQAGKRVRNETPIGEGSLSVSSLAAMHSGEIFGDLEQANVLIIGAGEMAQAAAAAFVRHGVDHLQITSQTIAHAQALADQWGGQALPFTQLGQALTSADLVIAAVTAPHPILLKADVAAVLPLRAGRKPFPLVIFDIALPRNVAPEVGDLDGVQLLNLDALQAVADAHMNIRKSAVPHALAIIAEEKAAFLQWQASRAAVPVIQSLRSKADQVRQTELDLLLRRLPDLDEHSKQLVTEFSQRLVNKLLHTPTLKLKEKSGESEQYASLVSDLFDLLAAPQ